MTLEERVQSQRRYFETGITQPLAFRARQLRNLRSVLKANEKHIAGALHADLRKAAEESYFTETGPILAEIRFALKNLDKWMQPRRVPGMVYSFFSWGKVLHVPKGLVLLIAPWNYPFWLSLNPLVNAMAAGNCILIKPSEHAPESAGVLRKILNDAFPAEYIDVAEGDASVAKELLQLGFDHIFFTGSTAIGKEVARATAGKLVPVTLELGGKTPCIVDETADPALSARRIVWGKTIAAGQVCVAPDYLLVQRKMRQPLLEHMQRTLKAFYPEGMLADGNYGCIVDEKHFGRLNELRRSGGKIILDGGVDEKNRKMGLTVVGGVSLNDRLMKEEIFGPVLPLLEYETIDEAIGIISKNPDPLAMYVFSKNTKNINRLIHEVSFGGCLVNDTVEHLGNPHLPFGGVRSSGIGAYHGRFGFDLFSHRKAVMYKSTWVDLPFRYPPFSRMGRWIVRRFLR